MKSVIFICLLSLSVSFSFPSPPEAAPSTQAAPVPKPNETEKTPPKTEPTQNLPAGTTVANTTNLTEAATQPTNAAVTIPTTGTTADNNTKPQTGEKTNGTDTKPEKTVPKPEETPADATQPHNETSNAVPDTKKDKTVPDANPTNETKMVTTPKSEVVSTEAPKIIQASRTFDGPSFIGGMILTLGLLAIGFMGFKYYKNQTERNYHTL